MSVWYTASKEVVGEMKEERRPGRWVDSDDVDARVLRESMMMSLPVICIRPIAYRYKSIWHIYAAQAHSSSSL